MNRTPAISTTLVAGASSAVGDFLLAKLVQADHRAIALGRSGRTATSDGAAQQIVWQKADLTDTLPANLAATSLIHLAPLWLLPGRLAEYASCGVKRIVALGSTSVHTKAGSSDSAERALVEGLVRAETTLATASEKHGMVWTLLRPTMIYGTGRDANIAAVATFIRRFGFFPLAGRAGGLRSPVHAEDVADACLAALAADAACNRAYDIGGGETLTYRDMVARVFAAVSMPQRLLTLPPFIMEGVATMASLAGVPGINAELVRRMNRDQVFAHDAAVRDLNYAPRRFQPRF